MDDAGPHRDRGGDRAEPVGVAQHVLREVHRRQRRDDDAGRGQGGVVVGCSGAQVLRCCGCHPVLVRTSRVRIAQLCQPRAVTTGA